MTFEEREELADRIASLFDENESFNQNEFQLVKNKLSTNPQINALLILEKYNPERDTSVIKGTEHDTIYLVGFDDCNEELINITDEELLDLLRCGVHFDQDEEHFYMFV